LDVWFLTAIIGDIQVNLILISVYFILIEKSNTNQMFNLFVCIRKMRIYLLLEHPFMLLVGVKRKEEHRRLDSRKRAYLL